MVMGLGYGMQDYMMGGMNPYMMSAYSMMGNQGSYLNFKNEDDMKNYYSSRVDDSQASLYAAGQGRNSQRIYGIVDQLKGALEEGDSSEVGEVLEKIKGDKYTLAGVEQAYDLKFGGRTALRQDIRQGMGGSKLLDYLHLGSINKVVHDFKVAVMKPFGLKPMDAQTAIEEFNKGAEVSTVVAANAMKEATMGAGTDRKTINFIVSNANGRMNEINASYNQMGANMTHDVREGFNPFIDGPAAAEHVNTKIAAGLV